MTLFCDKWNREMMSNISWRNVYDGGPHEANFLKLDCSKAKSVFDWKPRWNIETAMGKIVEWSKVYLEGNSVSGCMDNQIRLFLSTK